MKWYKIYQVHELPSVPWGQFVQSVRWNLAATEFILEYYEEPADKTGVLNRDEAAAYTKTTDWETYDDLVNLELSGKS